jgi:predicted AlkP superfamily phosphohydrolase/phosphomutase
MFDFLKRKSNGSNGKRRLFVIGLDCADPALVFDHVPGLEYGGWRKQLPNLDKLISSGVYGSMESCMPAITVPAWSVMTSSKDPGTLGIYGFRNRADWSYDNMSIATSAYVKEDRVWDLLGRAGKQVIVIGVPAMYPVKPVNGVSVGCFLTPNVHANYTYPANVAGEIESWVGEYLVDVPQFRTENKDFLLKQIYEMTDKRFQVCKHMLKEKPWDFFMFVEMGVDRIHHGMWKFIDPGHPKHEPGNPYVNSILDYYKAVDGRVGELLGLLDDDTAVMVVSDHGAKRMVGGICVNEWLWRNGYLAFKDEPPGGRLTPFEKLEVDWSRTKAWGSGGYYGRVFLNVEGREPAGIVPRSQYEAVRDELIAQFAAIRDPQGRDIGTVSYKPETSYRTVRNFAPDLMVYFGNLNWRAVGSLGHGSYYTFENDTGPDDANHAQHGIFVFHDPRKSFGGTRVNGLQLMDFAPTVLDYFGLQAPADMQGHLARF